MPDDVTSTEEGCIKDCKNKSLDVPELRRRRYDGNVELRKAQRTDHVMKKCNAGPEDPEFENEQQEILRLLSYIVERIKSIHLEDCFLGTQACRKLLSWGKDLSINAVLSSGVLQYLVCFLQYDDWPDLQCEAAWVITNLASGTEEEHIHAICQSGACQGLIALLDLPNPDIRAHAVWALGNIVGESADCRDFVLQLGAAPPLLRLLNSQPNAGQAVWTLSNLCRGKNPLPDWEIVKHFIPTLARTIYSQDEGTILNSCWAFSYLTYVEEFRVCEVVKSGVVPRLVELLTHPNEEIIPPALRTIGNICTAPAESLTQSVLDAGALVPLRNLLTASKELIKKEACWIISNITAGSPSQVQAVLESNIVPLLIEIMRVGRFKEATWAISNITLGCDPWAISFIVQHGCIGPFCDLVGSVDVNVLKLVLNAFFNMLKVGQTEAKRRGGANQIANFIEDAGGVEKIDALQQHANPCICQTAYKIIDTFFSDERDEDVQELQPEVSSSGASIFNTAAVQARNFKL
eukprot:Colp12_sorted_trinity150504_noHs@26743